MSNAQTMTLTLVQRVLTSEPSAAGLTQYEGGELHEGNRCVGTFGIVRSVINGVTDMQNLDTSMEETTLFFFAQQGQGQSQGQSSTSQSGPTVKSSTKQ